MKLIWKYHTHEISSEEIARCFFTSLSLPRGYETRIPSLLKIELKFRGCPSIEKKNLPMFLKYSDDLGFLLLVNPYYFEGEKGSKIKGITCCGIRAK